jgi:electron transport complex protein RnfD
VSASNKTLEIRTSPHIAGDQSTDVIMRNVVVAALPIAAFAIYSYGLTALALLLVATFSCVLTEHLLCHFSGKPSTIGDWSAAVTGLLLGLTLPPGLPLWMAAAGGFFAIALGKTLFGGLGFNTFNPALVGRAVIQGAFPVAMTTWSPPFFAGRFQTLLSSSLTLPFKEPVMDVISGATPLAAMKFDHQLTASYDMAMGFIGGSTGETSSVLILLGGAYLAARNMLNWRIPAVILATVAGLSGIFHLVSPEAYPTPIFMLFAGGLFFGAIFMATDMVTSPVTNLGNLIFGVLIGSLVIIIRFWGGLPEGVQYSILLANGCVPIIDRLIKTRPYGVTKGSKAA